MTIVNSIYKEYQALVFAFIQNNGLIASLSIQTCWI